MTTYPEEVILVQGSISIVSFSFFAPIWRLEEERTALRDDASKVYSVNDVPRIFSWFLLLQRLAWMLLTGAIECGFLKLLIEPWRMRFSYSISTILALDLDCIKHISSSGTGATEGGSWLSASAVLMTQTGAREVSHRAEVVRVGISIMR